MRNTKLTSGVLGLLLALLAIHATGCTTTECGVGTINRDGKCVRSLKHAGRTSGFGIAITPDGSFFFGALGIGASSVVMFSVATGAAVVEVGRHSGTAYRVAVNAAFPTIVASASYDSTVAVWTTGMSELIWKRKKWVMAIRFLAAPSAKMYDAMQIYRVCVVTSRFIAWTPMS